MFNQRGNSRRERRGKLPKLWLLLPGSAEDSDSSKLSRCVHPTENLCWESLPERFFAAKPKIGKRFLQLPVKQRGWAEPRGHQGWRGRSCASPSTPRQGQLNHGIIKAGKGLQGHKAQPLTEHQPAHRSTAHPTRPS